MAHILSPSGLKVPLIGTEGKKKFLTLAQMQKAVDGNIEPVYTKDHSKALLIINEEAGFREDLDMNDHARKIIANEYGVSIAGIVPIHGDVIVLDGDDGENWW